GANRVHPTCVVKPGDNRRSIQDRPKTRQPAAAPRAFFAQAESAASTPAESLAIASFGPSGNMDWVSFTFARLGRLSSFPRKRIECADAARAKRKCDSHEASDVVRNEKIYAP